jgi:hypothetical protein
MFILLGIGFAWNTEIGSMLVCIGLGFLLWISIAGILSVQKSNYSLYKTTILQVHTINNVQLISPKFGVIINLTDRYGKIFDDQITLQYYKKNETCHGIKFSESQEDLYEIKESK